MLSDSRQTDLFETQAGLFAAGEQEDDPDRAEYVDDLRRQLHAKLAHVQAAQGLPWRDLTATTLEELSFHSLARSYLPEAESLPLRRAFNKEMRRIYEIINDVPLFPDLR